MSGRRKAKPNRGGGRFNKPKGGGGGGGGKKGWDYDDDDDGDFSLDLRPSHSNKPTKSTFKERGVFTPKGYESKRGRGRGSTQGVPRFFSNDPKPAWERSERVKLPLQKIHMTSENRLQVKELLKELQSQEYNNPVRSVHY